ncbi:MAG: plasmid pRiA4b ORF-3 family protein [Terriglobales bacterium]
MPDEVYQIKVTLLGTKPPIWRRLLVPAIMTLAQLHDALQIAMGWQDCHLHEFEIGGQRYGVPDPEMDVFGERVMNEKKARLCNVLGTAGAKALYTYDFGDGWEHSVVVEKAMKSEDGTAYPICTGGKRHCPPEDCGGIYGYYDFLDAIADPNHKQHGELLEWIGGRFDPDDFSVEKTNAELANLQRRFAKA